MTTIADLVRGLADGLGVERSSVTVAARKLQLDGAVPIGERGRLGGVAMTPEHAASLLIGYMAAPRVCDSAVAARIFGEMPAISHVFQQADVGRIIRTGRQIQDVPVASGGGPWRTVLTRSLHGALAGIIGGAAFGLPPAWAPTEIGFNRDLAAPVGWMCFPISAFGEEQCSAEIFYAPCDGVHPSERFRSDGLRITASAGGAVFQRLGEVLREDVVKGFAADFADAERRATPDKERAHA